MKRFVLKCLILIAATGIILYITSALYIRSDAFRILEMSEKEWTSEYHTMPDQIDVAVFGASHAHLGFRSYPAGTVPFNFALSAQTPQYDLMQMLEYQDHIRPGGFVVLTVSYLSPYWPEHDSEFARKQPRYYRILSPEHIIEFDRVEYVLSKYFPIMAQDLPTVFNSLFRPGSIISSQDGSKSIDVSTLSAQQANITNGHCKAIMSTFPDTNPTMMDAYC